MSLYIRSMESGETFGSVVEEGNVSDGVNGYDTAVHRRENVINILVHENDLLIELSVLSGHGRLAYERFKEIDVFGEVGIARSLWSNNNNPDKCVVVGQRECDIAAECGKFLRNLCKMRVLRNTERFLAD